MTNSVMINYFIDEKYLIRIKKFIYLNSGIEQKRKNKKP